MRFFGFIAKNVLRRKVRSVLTGIGVAVAIAAVVALLGVSSGFEKSSRDMLKAHGVDIVVVRKGLSQQTTARIDESFGLQIAKIPEVDKVAGVLADRVKVEDSSVRFFLTGYPAGSFALDSANKNLQSSGDRALTAADKDDILLGAILAHNLNKKAGDKLKIEGREFTVAGVFNGASIVENGGAVALLPDLQSLMERTGQVSKFEVVLKGEFKTDEAAQQRIQVAVEKLRNAEGKPAGLDAETTQQSVDKSNEVKLSTALAWMTSAIALVIGAVGMLNTMIMSVLERTQEIGILRAIGWKKLRIMRMILWESFTLSLVGAVAGTLAALILTRLVSALPAASGLVEPNISWTVIGIGFLMAMLVGLIGGAYPAFRGASLAPTEALRYE